MVLTTIATTAAIQFGLSLAAHLMPKPKRGQGLYRQLYKAVQFTAANLDRLKDLKRK